MVAAFSSKIPPAVPTAQDARGTVATALLRPSRINPWRLFFGAMIPNWLLCRAEVGQGAKLCYARLMQYSGEGGRCYPKQKTLAPELGVSSRQVRGYLTELAQFGLIESEQHGLCRSNDYYFLDHPWIHEGQPAAQSASGQDGQSASGQDGQSSSGQDRHESSAPSREEIHAKENHTKKNQVNVPPPPRGDCVQAQGSLVSAQTEELYSIYPKQVGKPAALRAIQRALANHPFDFLLDRAQLYAKTCNSPTEFTPNPSTWYNQARFNDNPATWRRTFDANGKPPPAIIRPEKFGCGISKL